MNGGIPKGKPSPSTNSSEREPYQKGVSNPRKEEKECNHEATKEHHHISFSGDSLSPQRKKQRSDDNTTTFRSKI